MLTNCQKISMLWRTHHHLSCWNTSRSRLTCRKKFTLNITTNLTEVPYRFVSEWQECKGAGGGEEVDLGWSVVAFISEKIYFWKQNIAVSHRYYSQKVNNFNKFALFSIIIWFYIIRVILHYFFANVKIAGPYLLYVFTNLEYNDVVWII